MSGKLIAMFILVSAAIAGGALYYLQVYHFYDAVAPQDVSIRLTEIASGAPQEIPVTDLQAIDAGSSPIRFRACFATPLSQAMLTETFQIYDAAEPLTAPGWFDCFDANAIGAALEDGSAIAFLSETGIATGVDRVIAILPDGRGFAWHQLQPGFGD